MGDRLAGRVAIVTGAGEGIGRGIARRFAREGAAVVVGELRDEWGERTARELTDELGAEARFVHADVAVKRDAVGLVETTVDAFGRVDVLVNNAQAFTPLVPLEDKADEWMAQSLGLRAVGIVLDDAGRVPAHARPGWRPHHQLLLAQRRHWRVVQRRLQRDQGGHPRAPRARLLASGVRTGSP